MLDTIIIGSGPAGYTAAIYAARAGMSVALFQGVQPGGQLTITTEVENFPGFAQGIQGPELMQIFEAQARRMGAEIIFDTIIKVNFSSRPFVVYDGTEKMHQAKTIIISTGSSAKWLGLPSEQRLNGYGVSACAVCDGFFFKGKDVCIVGAGDTACEEAIYLSKICNKVHMLVRKDYFKASAVMAERVHKTANIIIHFNTETDEILGDKKVEGVRIKNNKTQQITELSVSAFFVAIGHVPNTDLFKGIVDLDDQDYIITKAGSTDTNIKGIFAAGDVQDKKYRQAITAAGSGCMAALDAKRYLDGHA